MDGRMDGRMDGQHNGSGDGQKDGQKDGQHNSSGDGKKMDGRRKDGWKDKRMDGQHNSSGDSRPHTTVPSRALVFSSPQEGRRLLCPHLYLGLGDRRVKPWSLALLCGPLRLTGFAAPDLHSWVY